MKRTCFKCKQTKAIEEFNKSSRKTHQGFQRHCKNCTREYYLSNKNKHLENVKRIRKKHDAKIQSKVIEFLLKHPCIDCGEADIIVLDFDHLSNKKDNVSTMVTNNQRWEAIYLEIKKCVVRCSNCHRRKTAKENNSYKYKYGDVSVQCSKL